MKSVDCPIIGVIWGFFCMLLDLPPPKGPPILEEVPEVEAAEVMPEYRLLLNSVLNFGTYELGSCCYY